MAMTASAAPGLAEEADWAPFFADPDVPFSWEPDQVEVLASGNLAIGTGRVRDPAGKAIARFNSVGRLEAPNRWRVVIDKGSPPSPGPPATPASSGVAVTHGPGDTDRPVP